MDPKQTFNFRQMDEASARQILYWQYPPPFDIYNFDPVEIEGEVQNLLRPDYHYYSAWRGDELVGFRCFGADARVPGGDYAADALDMGGGLRPDLTGQGLGAPFMRAALALGQQLFRPRAFRATVAEFNTRALRVCEKVGYRPMQKFKSTHSGEMFVILLREAGRD